MVTIFEYELTDKEVTIDAHVHFKKIRSSETIDKRTYVKMRRMLREDLKEIASIDWTEVNND